MSVADRTKPGRLAESMPEIALWVSNLREAFGDAEMDDIIVRGRRGEPVFYVMENGHCFGTKLPLPVAVWRGDGLSARHFCSGCDGSCIGTARRCVRP